MAYDTTTTTAQPPATGITSFVDAFLVDLNAAVSESARFATGEIENALHQKLVSCGDKKKQARQLNAVAKGSSAYMERIQKAFEKNFDKFELYVRRNIVMIPADVSDRVDALHQQRLRDAQSSTTDATASTQPEQEDLSHLSPSERREKELEDSLHALRQQIRQLEHDTQRMTLEQAALETNAQQFKDVAAKLEFLELLPQTTISPLKRTAEHVAALQHSMQRMEGVQTKLEEDTRAFKRQKMATRDSFGNLRHRYLSRIADTTYATVEDLNRFNATLSGA